MNSLRREKFGAAARFSRRRFDGIDRYGSFNRFLFCVRHVRYLAITVRSVIRRLRRINLGMLRLFRFFEV